MHVENITGVRFTTRRTAQQQGNLTVGPCLLGQVIVYDQGIFTLVAEVLTHGATGVRSDVLQRSGVGCGRGNHDGVLQRAVLFEFAHHVGDGRGLLANRNVDTLNAGALLVDDGVDGHRGLTGLAVTDDQLALATTDRHHGVNGLQAGLHRLVNGLTPQNAGGDLLDGRRTLGFDRTFTIDGVTQGVDNATQQGFTDRHFHDATGAGDLVAFGDVLVRAENYRTDGVALQVQCHTKGVVGEFQHLARHNVSKAVDAGNTVGQADHGAFSTRLGDCFKA